MNDWAVLLSAVMGRDVSKEIAALARVRAALGSALSPEQVLFVNSHWGDLHAWLGSASGREIVQFAVQEWQHDTLPPTDLKAKEP